MIFKKKEEREREEFENKKKFFFKMPKVTTDNQRVRAGQMAIYQYRSLSCAALKYFPLVHDCVLEKCTMKHIHYQAYLRRDIIVVRLAPDLLTDDFSDLAFDRLNHVYICEISGRVHYCNDHCEFRNATVCPLTGVTFAQESHDIFWTPEQKSNPNDWKLNIFRSKRISQNDIFDVRDRMYENSSEIFSPNLIKRVRSRPKIHGKRTAFAIAYAINIVLFCDERFIHAIACLRQSEDNLQRSALRAQLRLEQAKVIPNTATILAMMASSNRAQPIMLTSLAYRRDCAVHCAEHLIALWHLLFQYAQPILISMSFRNFCVAAIHLFEQGYNAPDWHLCEDRWIIQVNEMVASFPINHWVEQKVFYNLNKKNIPSVMRRSELQLKRAIQTCINKYQIHSNYLRYSSLSYDAVPEDAFNDLRS